MFTAVLFAFLLFGPAETPGEEDFEAMTLEELLNMEVSVASQFVETERETSSTVEVVTAESWRHYGAETIGDAISHQPSVMVYPTAWGGSAIAIRGFASSLSVRGIATVMDGIPLNGLRAGTALYDARNNVLQAFDQIEMIRGTGSALYGSDAFHGVISLKTYRREENHFEAGASVTSEGYSHLNTGITRQLGGSVLLNVSVAGISQGDQDTPYVYTSPFTGIQGTATRDDSYDAYTAAIKFDVSHSERLNTHYALYMKGHDSIDSVGGGRSISGNSVLLDRDISDGDNSVQAAKFTLDYQFDNSVNIEGKLYGWHNETDTFTDISNIPGFGFSLLSNYEEDLLGAELLVKQSENAWNFQWAVGYSYKEQELTDINDFALAPDRTVLSPLPVLGEGFKRDVSSLIFEGKLKFVDEKLQLTLGNRYDDYSDFGGQNSPRVSLVYLPDDRSSIKASYGEAFRAPISAEIFGTTTLLGNADLAPEVIGTAELAYLYQAENWKFGITLFESEWEDGITLQPTQVAGFTAEYSNVGQNESHGVEVLFRGGKGPWRWDMNGSYVESEAILAAGEVPFGAFPKTIVNANFGYEWQARNLDFFVTNRAWFDAKEGPAINLIPNPEDIDDYYATDFSTTWTYQERLQLRATVRNLFDRENAVPSVWNAEGGYQTPGLYGQLAVNYRF